MDSWVIEAGFWSCVLLIAYVPIGYPLTLAVLGRRQARLAASPESLPTVTVIIAAYNEAAHIVDTVLNKLAQDYPPHLLDVIVVSDGSSDGTDDGVASVRNPRVTLVRQEPRQGKTEALNRGMRLARGEIVVFSDANTKYEPTVIRTLVAAFEDPSVGYVTGQLVYRDPGETAVGAGSGIYMQYENWLRRLETRVGSVVGVNGGVDAVRRRLYKPMRPDQLPDFVLPLEVVQQNHRVVYCEQARAYEDALGRQHDEYKMRVRVSLRALHALSDMRSLFGIRYGLFAFQLLIHKAARYLMVFPHAGALVFNALLIDEPMYRAFFVVQVTCYALAFVGWLSGGRIRARPVFVPYYFCLINIAASAAFVRFLRGQRHVLWTPRKGA